MHPNTMSASAKCGGGGYLSTVAFVVVLSNVLFDIPRIVWIVGDVVYSYIVPLELHKPNECTKKREHAFQQLETHVLYNH